jgi:hypothetical protein
MASGRRVPAPKAPAITSRYSGRISELTSGSWLPPAPTGREHGLSLPDVQQPLTFARLGCGAGDPIACGISMIRRTGSGAGALHDRELARFAGLVRDVTS